MSLTNPDVTIIITNYNYSKYLARAVRSCLNQSNISHEVIVVDDCSTDDSLDVLHPFKDDVKIVSTSRNSGVATAANLGVKHSRGQFFVRVDAYDYVNFDLFFLFKTFL